MKAKNQSVDILFQALVLIDIAYKENLINKTTYQAIMKKYGGKYNGLHE